jgi:DNA polymerase III subunit delta'
MVFDSILGQPTAVETLKQALARGRLHHAYRFEGPDGVGKERAAFALAQSLVCTASAPLGCGVCSACRRAVTLSEEEPQVPQHPDVVLLERGLYPAATLGRTSPETTGIGVEQIRRIVLARADYPPHEAPHLVFIVRAAHELTVSAGNALLKTIEEPRRGVHFILLTSQPRRLSDTIRSRTLPVRFGPLPESAIASILEANGRAPAAAALAEGSARRALELSDPEQLAERQQFVDGVMSALTAPDLGAALEFAAGHASDRTSLSRDLQSLAQHFALLGRQHVGSDRARAKRFARHYAETEVARTELEKNAPPTLALETLIARLRLH